MNKYPCRCHFIPDVVFKEMKKDGYDVEQPKQATFDKNLRQQRQGLMAMSAMPQIGNNERLIYDSQNTNVKQSKIARKEGEAPTTDADVNAVYDNGGIVRDYFKNVLGWDSINNSAMDLVLNVHYQAKYNNGYEMAAARVFVHKKVIIF